MSFAALALRARAANDTTRAQINNIPEKSHVIPLFMITVFKWVYFEINLSITKCNRLTSITVIIIYV